MHWSKTEIGAPTKNHRNLLASLSDSSKVRISPSLTGPLTFLMMNRFWSSTNFTLTWVTCPLDPVRPMTFTTTACFTVDSILHNKKGKLEKQIFQCLPNLFFASRRCKAHLPGLCLHAMKMKILASMLVKPEATMARHAQLTKETLRKDYSTKYYHHKLKTSYKPEK